MKLRHLLFVILAALPALTPPVQAQEFPTRPITLVIPMAAGDSGDIAARAIGIELGRLLNTPVVPVNRPGAGGAVAALSVVKSVHDGYTILYTQNSALTYRPVLEPEATMYNPIRDLTPLALASRTPMVLTVRNDGMYRSFDALIAQAKRQPGTVRVGVPGIGSAADFSVHAINMLTDAGLTTVPFNGSSPALSALIGGHIEAVVLTQGVVGQQIEAGALRALAASDKLALMPGVPTLQDLGYQHGLHGVWFAFLAPVGLPDQVNRRLQAAIRDAVMTGSVADRLRPLGIVQDYGSPDMLTERIRSEQQSLGLMKGKFTPAHSSTIAR